MSHCASENASFYPVGPKVSWHIPEIGQSLGIGFDKTGQVITEPWQIPDNILMFNGGIRPIDGSRLQPSKPNNTTRLKKELLQRLIPAAENSNGRFHETHLSSLASALFSHMPEKVGEIVVSAHGFGLTPYSELKKGSSAYDNMLSAIKAHAHISAREGKNPIVPFVTMVHGESDKARDVGEYMDIILELLSDIQMDVRLLTGQEKPPFMILAQTGVCHKGKVSDVAQAQMMAQDANCDVICIGPKYHWEFSDQIHLKSSSYRIMGEMMAKFASVKLRDEEAKPLRLTGVRKIQDRHFRLKFQVPVEPLQVGLGGAIEDPGDLGIEIIQKEECRKIKIDSISQSSGTTIDVLLDEDVPPELIEVRIAMQDLFRQGPTSGPRSLIKDSDGEIGLFSRESLANWCCHGIATISDFKHLDFFDD